MEHSDPFRLEKNKGEHPEQEKLLKKKESLPTHFKTIMLMEIQRVAKWPLTSEVKILTEWVPPLKNALISSHQKLTAEDLKLYVAIVELSNKNYKGTVVKKWATVSGIAEDVQIYDSLQELFDPMNLEDKFRLRLGPDPAFQKLAQSNKVNSENWKLKPELDMEKGPINRTHPNLNITAPSSPAFREGRRYPMNKKEAGERLKEPGPPLERPKNT